MPNTAIEPPQTIASARRKFALTADGNELALIPQAVYVGGAGDIYCQLADDTNESGDAAPFLAVPAGTILPIQPRRIFAATSATRLLGLIW